MNQIIILCGQWEHNQLKEETVRFIGKNLIVETFVQHVVSEVKQCLT